MSVVSLQARVAAVTREAEGIAVFELQPLDGTPLPGFTAGAHIDVLLDNGLVRSYSLINPQDERHRYVIAVNRDSASRGGSVFMHEHVAPGGTLRISAPRNNFELVEDAPHVVFVAGGIGITPIWCMIQRLEALGRSWELYYCARTRASAAFLGALEPFVSTGRVHLNFDHEPGGRLLDVAGVIGSVSSQAHLYCCGPAPLLSAFQQASRSFPAAQVHVEYFSAEVEAAAGGFTVVLASSGREIRVPEDKTILEALLDHGIDVPHSCMQGICGSCETRLIEGVPDHRDCVLTDDERMANRTLMICCSGSKSERLVLDL